MTSPTRANSPTGPDRSPNLDRPTRPTRAVVDLDAIARNFRFLRERAGAAEVIPVVKADAYGHGAVPVARRLSAEGARRFAVALAEEGVELRDAGLSQEIVLLSSGDPASVGHLASRRLTPVIHDLEQARAMEAEASRLGLSLPVHLKLDTGMGRLGIRPEDLAAAIDFLRGSRALTLAGTFTQFSNADDPDSAATGAQLAKFTAALATLRDARIDPGLVHAANSAGLLAFPDARFDAVRAGLALYGVASSERLAEASLSEAFTLETHVMAVRRVPAGTPLGYGGTFVTSRTTAVAVLPIGYHDGLRRTFSGRVSALLSGGRAPIVGAISMDLTLVDATDCGARVGDRAVLLGASGGDRISAWDLARAAGTIPWEILCGIGSRVPRVYEYEP